VFRKGVKAESTGEKRKKREFEAKEGKRTFKYSKDCLVFRDTADKSLLNVDPPATSLAKQR